MNNFKRTPIPSWLHQNYKRWGIEWETTYKKSTRSSDFSWRQFENKGYEELRIDLLRISKNHCAFCDAYPLGPRVRATVEHFRPKVKYPLLAYVWHNLFPCCDKCQLKGDDFDKHLLKPDVLDYDFDKYFRIDSILGLIIPNPQASELDQKRAKKTIELYKLNENGKPDDRKEELEKYELARDVHIDKWSYRFFLERLT